MVFTIAFICLMTAVIIPGVMGEPVVNLGTAGNYVILAESGITTTGNTNILGDIAVSPIAASSMTGFGLIMDSSGQFSTSSLVDGKVYASDYAIPTPSILTTAVGDMHIAYTDAAGRATSGADFLNVGTGHLNGQTLAPGVYTWGGTLNIDGDIYLDAQNDPNAVWIFQVAGTLDLAVNKKVILINGAQAKNIFWQIAGATTLLTSSTFEGNILAKTNIAMQSGAVLNGRALAQTAVTLIGSTLNIPEIPIPPINQPPVLKPIGDKTVCSTKTLTFTISGTDLGDVLTYSASGLPTGAVFDSGTKTFTWTPGIGQAGTYPVTFTVTDSGGLSDSETVTITVSNDGTCRPPKPCSDFVTGGGWINDKATFGVSGGIKNDKFWGDLSFNDHNGVKVKSTKVTAYTVIDPVTRKIEGIAKVNGKGSFAYTVIVADNSEPGRNKDTFSLQLSNGYSTSGILKGGNIQLHMECGKPHDNDDKEKYDDKYERDGHNDCDNDRLNGKDLSDRNNDNKGNDKGNDKDNNKDNNNDWFKNWFNH